MVIARGSHSDMVSNGAQPEVDLSHRRKHHHHHHHRHHHHRSNKLIESTFKNNNANTYQLGEDEPDVTKRKRGIEGENMKFINSSEKLSDEVRKANIVGNSMLSVESKEGNVVDDGCLGIEDLSLAMDYKQIMEYFDNLKESTA
jgi:hypothetical protein